MRVRRSLKRFGISEIGATAVEYGLIAAMISVVIISALQLASTSLQRVFNNIASTLSISISN
jgi:pilus assembly protein Flp/PilA